MKLSLIRTFMALPLLPASPGTGYALVGIDAVARTMSVWVSFSNLIGFTKAAHIHVINGPGDVSAADLTGGGDLAAERAVTGGLRVEAAR